MLRKKAPLVATVGLVTIALIGLIPTLNDQFFTEVGASSTCTDVDDIISPPDGLVIGGPEDNTDVEPYASWMVLCDPGGQEEIITLYEPFDELHAEWQECVDNHSINWTSVEDACGDEPDDSNIQEDGTIPINVTMTHDGANYGSISYSSHQYTSSGTKKAPINVIFYGNGDGHLVQDLLIAWSHWEDTPSHHWGDCNSKRKAYIWDSSHGGQDKWWNNDPISEAHHDGSCYKSRYHLRSYGLGLTDTHSPGFGSYSTGNVHWEDDWHNTVDNEPWGHVKSEYDSISESSYKKWWDSINMYRYYFKIGADADPEADLVMLY